MLTRYRPKHHYQDDDGATVFVSTRKAKTRKSCRICGGLIHIGDIYCRRVRVNKPQPVQTISEHYMQCPGDDSEGW